MLENLPAARLFPPRTASQGQVGRPRIALGLVASALAGLTLTACAPTINVPAGADAANPACARTVLMVPGEVAGQPKVKASSQATAAWGEPGAAITLRCGVEVPPPTTQDCQSIDPAIPGLGSFDWITTQDANGWTFTTFGREPAVSVQVPTALGGSQPTAALVDLSRAIDELPTNGHTCK